MNLLLLEPDETELLRGDPRFRHISRILRLEQGDSLRAGVVGGSIGRATLASVEADRVSLRFQADSEPPPLPPVTLLLGHPRPIVLRRMLRDLTAVGIGRLVVIPTDTGEKSYANATLWDDPRTPMLEGAAQASTTRIPELVRASSLESAFDEIDSPADANDVASRGGHETRLVLHGESDRPGIVATRLQAALGSLADRVVVAVGSERGWSPAELDLFRERGFEPVTIGARVLRTENAALVASWAAVQAYEAREPTGGTQ